MKHLRRIFEAKDLSDSEKTQKEEIEDSFLQYIDTEDCYVEDEPNGFEDNNTHLLISFPKGSTLGVNDMSEFDSLIKEEEENIILLKKIKTCLSRVEYDGYTWAFEQDDDSFHIKVFYKNTKLTLEDAFGGKGSMNRVDINMMKTVLKRDYNIEFDSYRDSPSTSGFYGKRAEVYLYIKKPINNDNKFIVDLKNIIKEIRYTSGKMDLRKAFYNVELIHNGRTIKLELD